MTRTKDPVLIRGYSCHSRIVIFTFAFLRILGGQGVFVSFVDNLKALPEFTGSRLVLADPAGVEVATIANAPGTAGSFRVYAYLTEKYGGITPAAAAEGLAIYAEHTEDARAYPGKHPNIDRLLAVTSDSVSLTAAIET